MPQIPIQAAPFEKLMQLPTLIFIFCNNHFPTYLVWDAMPFAEIDHGGRTRNAHSCLQRTGPVVNAGMDYAAVTAALMSGFLCPGRPTAFEENAG
jgi:hypothetical protein